jgi:drug/metabolite transporter (DMT)-like permease
MKILEWLATLLMVVGVVFIAESVNGTGIWKLLVGSLLLTIGVRVSIECGRVGR